MDWARAAKIDRACTCRLLKNRYAACRSPQLLHVSGRELFEYTMKAATNFTRRALSRASPGRAEAKSRNT